MPILGLNPEKCEQRNRIAAQRYGIDAVPLRVLPDKYFVAPDSRRTKTDGVKFQSKRGALPADDQGILDLIHAKQPEGATPLTFEQVHRLYAEAANDNFIEDRYMFLSEKTLQNIAEDAIGGFAFMNSHRTGGLSAPSELPFGRTYGAEYQTGEYADGKQFRRTVIGVYMLKGAFPNGRMHPSTDDLADGFNAGINFDVSVGLHGGERICDVCDLLLNDCSHYPGTTHGMTDEQIDKQKARGIKGGRATYTYHDGRCSETSPVYDGAVPGAGVQKVFSHRGELSAETLQEAVEAFGSLLTAAVDAEVNAEAETSKQQVHIEHLHVHTGGAVAPDNSNSNEGVTTMSTATTAANNSNPPAPQPATQPAQSAAPPATDAQLSTAGEGAVSLAEFNRLKAENEQAKQDAAAAKASVAKLEQERRLDRFTDLASKWPGATANHVSVLEHLSQTAEGGEESELFKGYVDNCAAAAAQTAAIESQFGSARPSTPSNAEKQLESLAKERQRQDGCTYEQAFKKVVKENPELAQKYDREQGQSQPPR